MRWADYEGNGDIDSGQRDNFWLYGDWGVSPKDQIRMLVKLYKNELPFSRASMDTVKSFMCNENTCEKPAGHKRMVGISVGGSDTLTFSK